MTEISQHTSEENPVTVDESVVAQARHGLQEIADNKSHVGDFVAAYEIAENVLDFRFTSLIVGYEGWQSVHYYVSRS
ncbi:hypothetical protein [Alloscardovia omnicolens]|uniref:hypothetical protein n=1 Tax=Alloscardovia omnicolens TaxID=419015 RepID=UPI003A6969FB